VQFPGRGAALVKGAFSGGVIGAKKHFSIHHTSSSCFLLETLYQVGKFTVVGTLFFFVSGPNTYSVAQARWLSSLALWVMDSPESLKSSSLAFARRVPESIKNMHHLLRAGQTKRGKL
jgi:hypothetical protein